MNYKNLESFISQKMRMSHYYQPVMIKTLLKNKGKATQEAIAKALKKHGDNDFKYYMTVTRSMVGKVLQNRDVVKHDKEKNTYTLIGFSAYAPTETQKLIKLCDKKLKEYKA